MFNGSPLFTRAAGSGESEIRRWVIENDWLDQQIADIVRLDGNFDQQQNDEDEARVEIFPNENLGFPLGGRHREPAAPSLHGCAR